MFLVGLLILSLGSASQEATKVRAAKETGANEMREALRELKSAHDLQLHWEIVGPTGNTLGCSFSWTSPMVSNGAQGIRYINTALMKSLDGTVVETAIEAHLTPEFEPTYVTMVRKVEKSGKHRSQLDRAQVKDSEVVLTRQIDEGQPGGKVVPRPESPFILGLECIIEDLDCRRFPAFELREFNPQEGTIIAQHFKVQDRPEGGHIVVSSKEDGSLNYRFEMDAEGSIVSWREMVPISMQRTTAENAKKIRKDLFGGDSESKETP